MGPRRRGRPAVGDRHRYAGCRRHHQSRLLQEVSPGRASCGADDGFVPAGRIGCIVAAVCFFLFLHESDGNIFGGCPLQQCWDSYYKQLDDYGIREDFHNTQPLFPGQSSSSTTEWRRLCFVYRKFNTCVHKATRACTGDLNFHSTLRGVDRKIALYNCTTAKTPGKVEEGDEKTKDQEQEVEEEEIAEDEKSKCIIQESNSSLNRHCSLYGDPHLRTFDGVFQTCRIHGAWPLFDTDYLTVQITSAPVGVGEGTSISEVTVVIKRNDDCALDRYVTYQAQNGELSSTFDDGHVKFNSVEIFEVSPGHHIEIDIGYKHTVIIIRLTGLAYSVSVSLPDDIYSTIHRTADTTDSKVQLCHTGCPLSERVDLYSYVGQKSSKLKRTVVMSKKEAGDRCRVLRGFYFDSCVYDLMMTGNPTFTAASLASYSDLLQFVPDAVFTQRNTTYDDEVPVHLTSAADVRAIQRLWFYCNSLLFYDLTHIRDIQRPIPPPPLLCAVDLNQLKEGKE